MIDPAQHALESLTQHARSPLYREMTLCLQTVFDALEGPLKVTPPLLRKVLRDTKTAVHLAALLKTHTGFTLRAFYANSELQPGAGCLLLLPDVSTDTVPRTKLTRGMAMSLLSSFYDDKTGTLTKTPLTTRLSTFDMNIHTGCFMKDGNAFLFTAEQIAAVLLHEIGHIDTFIRSQWRTQSILSDGAEVVRYLQETPDTETITQLITLLNTNRASLPKEWQKTLTLVTGYFAEAKATFIKDGETKVDPLYIEALNVLATLIKVRSAEAIRQQYLTTTLETSRVASAFMKGTAERDSDEYATRHGAGTALLQFFATAETLRYDRYTLLHRTLYDQTPTGLIQALRTFDYLFTDRVLDLVSGYDVILVRLETILETQKHAFSKADLSPQDAAILKHDITQGLAYLKVLKATKGTQRRKQLDQWRDRMNTIGTIIATPFQDRLHQDYDTLQRATRALSRNPLYYIANK